MSFTLRLITLLITLINVQCSLSQNECSKFKTGEFIYVLKDRPEIIKRTDSYQIEVNPINDTEIHSSIQWISDCEYVLTYEKLINYPAEYNDVIGQKIYAEILSFERDKLRVYVKSARSNEEIELIKIK